MSLCPLEVPLVILGHQHVESNTSVEDEHTFSTIESLNKSPWPFKDCYACCTGPDWETWQLAIYCCSPQKPTWQWHSKKKNASLNFYQKIQQWLRSVEMVVHLPILWWAFFKTSKKGIIDDVYHKTILFNPCLLQRLLSMVLNLKIIFSINKCAQSKRKRKKERKKD